jgi:iron complex outermembrane receptor protein
VASTVTDPVNVQLVAIPRNTALLSAQWAPTEQIKTWTELRYIGRMNIDTTTVSGTQFVQGSATVVDWSARYALDRNTDLTASVVNLFDRKYNEAAYTYNQPYSRTLSMPMTLTLGVKARF